MERLAEAAPYRALLNRDRLVYLTHPDVDVCRSLCDQFITRGFQVSMVPEISAIGRLMSMRRPDLIVMALCDQKGEPDATLAALDAIRSQHLGIQTFLLAPPLVKAELVVQAMKRGATLAFSAPFDVAELVGAAEDIFLGDIRVDPDKEGREAISVKGFGALTFRERQILQFVVDGLTNKEIAVDLGLSYRTVEVHRRHIMEKTGARNTADLVRLAIES